MTKFAKEPKSHPVNLLTYALINPPDGAVIDANGIITWTPSTDVAPDILAGDSTAARRIY